MKDILNKVYMPNRDTMFSIDLKAIPNHRYLGDQKVLQVEKEAKLNRKTVEMHHLYTTGKSSSEDGEVNVTEEPKEELDSNLIKY